MRSDIDNLEIKDNQAMHRFETRIDGHLAEIEYIRIDDRIIFTHTRVPEALGGRGVGNHLAQVALDQARDQHLGVVPRCPFVAAYIRKHPAYQTLIVPE